MHSVKLHNAYCATKSACSWEKSRRIRGTIAAMLPFVILFLALAFGLFRATRIETFGKAALEAFHNSDSGLIVLSAEGGKVDAIPIEDLAGNRTAKEWEDWMRTQHRRSDERVIAAIKDIVERKSPKSPGDHYQ